MAPSTSTVSRSRIVLSLFVVCALAAGGLAWTGVGTTRGATPAAASAGAGAQAEADPAADSLVGRWIEALGGTETFNDFQSARFTLTTELYDPATGRMQRARPRYVTLAKMNGEQLARIERWHWSGARYIVQAFDGDTAWAYVNGEPAPLGQMDADEALYVTRDVFYWFSLPFKLRDPGVNLHYDGTDDEGRHVVRVTFGEGVGSDVWWYLFRDGRAWPVEVRYQTGGEGGISRLHWEGIRSVDGYFYPVERVHVNDRDRVWKILRMTDVRLNLDVPPETFTDPGASPWIAED